MKHIINIFDALSGDRLLFIKNTGALTIMQVAKYVFPLITLPYLARVLGPDAYSVRAYVVSYMVFMSTILDYGFSQFGTKAVAESSADSYALSRINSGVYFAKFGTFAIAAVVTVAITPFIEIMRCNALFVALSLLAAAFKAFLPDYVLQGLRDMRAIAIRFTVTQALAVLLIFVCVRSEAQLLLVPVIEGASSLISVIWTQMYLKRVYAIGFACFQAAFLVRILIESTPFFFATAASSFMSNTITVMMGIFSVNALILSCWAIAGTIISGVQALWQPISRSLFPHMVVSKDVSLIIKLLKIGVPIAALISMVCFVFSDQIMLIMGGPDYVDGSYVLKYVSPVILFSYPISIVGYPVIGAVGKPAELSICIAVTGGLQVLALLAAGLTGNFTIIFIAIVRCCTEALLCLLESIVAIRTLNRLNLKQV